MRDFVYSDLDSRLHVKNSGEIKIVYDEEVITQSIKTILSTISGERVRNPIGSSLVRLLFEPMTIDTARDIKQRMVEDIRRNEPRIADLSVFVRPDFDGNSYDVVINARVRQISRPIEIQTRLRAMGTS